ncbi:hypothetical protein BR93DRAFT_328650 [Coniochaeta sp. PMI_546]|nr:hypothetical protein BR93DRAFT_328650 [Coniochaeta sp. PMI_546]
MRAVGFRSLRQSSFISHLKHVPYLRSRRIFSFTVVGERKHNAANRASASVCRADDVVSSNNPFSWGRDCVDAGMLGTSISWRANALSTRKISLLCFLDNFSSSALGFSRRAENELVHYA